MMGKWADGARGRWGDGEMDGPPAPHPNTPTPQCPVAVVPAVCISQPQQIAHRGPDAARRRAMSRAKIRMMREGCGVGGGGGGGGGGETKSFAGDARNDLSGHPPPRP